MSDFIKTETRFGWSMRWEAAFDKPKSLHKGHEFMEGSQNDSEEDVILLLRERVSKKFNLSIDNIKCMSLKKGSLVNYS